MVKYNVASPSITGAIVGGASGFYAWQPSTWPAAPTAWEAGLVATIQQIFDESILCEIDNVIADAGGNLEHRGHVVAIALLCAMDAISSYGYGRKNGKQIAPFVSAHFPIEYRSHAIDLVKLYRHAMIHGWNLFEAAILPGNDPPTNNGGVLCFGLLNLREALSKGTEDYLTKLATNNTLQNSTLICYRKLRNSARV
jgi:hypothetical protein